MRTRWTTLAIAALVGGAAAEPVTGILTLDEGPGVNVVTQTYTFNQLIEASDSVVYSGTIEVQVDVEDDAVTALEMVGGRVEATDGEFVFDLGIFGSLTFRTIDLAATPTSPQGREVLAEPGVFSAPRHVFEFNEGRGATTSTVVGVDDEEGDVADDPFSANGVTNGAIGLSNKRAVRSTIDDRVMAYDYDVAFSVVMDSETAFINEEDQSLDVETTGLVTASGILRVGVTEFDRWAIQHAPDAAEAVAFTHDANGDGWDDGVLWALGHPPVRALAGVLEIDESTNELVVAASASGVSRALRVMQYLSEDAGWQQVPGGELPLGFVGEKRIATGGVGGVFRLEVVEE